MLAVAIVLQPWLDHLVAYDPHVSAEPANRCERIIPSNNSLQSANLEVGILQQLNIHPQPVLLLQIHQAALPSTRHITENGQSKLLQRRACLDDSLKTRYDPSLRCLDLTCFVETAEVVHRLEDVIRYFLANAFRRVVLGGEDKG
jgi:hypothetical protein